MALAHTHDPQFEREIRDSMRVIERQRSTRRLLAVFAVIGAVAVAMVSVYLMYSDEPASGPPAAGMR